MKITLIGSTKYLDQFCDANRILTLAGHVVYTVVQTLSAGWVPTPDEKMMLDLIHLEKIKESDYVCVVGEQDDGSTYIGESTRKELLWAEIQGKTIFLWRKWNKIEDIKGALSEFNETMRQAVETYVQREVRKSESHKAQHALLEQMGIPQDCVHEKLNG